MLPPLRAGVTLAQPNGPVIETERLKLRQWCGADVAPNAAMLSDPGTARFIATDGKPPHQRIGGMAQRGSDGRTLGAARCRHVCCRGKIQRKIRRAGRTLVSAGLAGL